MESGNTTGHAVDPAGDRTDRAADPGGEPQEPAVAELQLPPGIPASIPFARVQELVSALGLPLDDLIGFSLYPNAIEAEFYAVNENGRRYILGHDNQVAIHKVVIEVKR